MLLRQEMKSPRAVQFNTKFFMPDSAAFSKITIVQSLGPKDSMTGRQLYDDTLLVKAFYQRGLGVEFVNVASTRELSSLLEKLVADAQTNGTCPILHIECHGNGEGLELADKSFVSWLELKPFLVSLNQATRCRLFIALAACHGAYLFKTVHLTDRAPFWGMVGPPYIAKSHELFKHFADFYTKLLDTTPHTDDALTALLKSSDYFFTSANTLFKHAYALHLRKERCLYPRQLRRRLGNKMRTDFEQRRRQFFMIDLCTENDLRFSVNFDEVEALSKGCPGNATHSTKRLNSFGHI